MALVDELKTRRDTIVARLNALTSTDALDLPNTTGDGVNLDKTGKIESLYKELAAIDEAISRNEGPALEETLMF